MVKTSYHCDQCKKPIGPELTEAMRGGALELRISGSIGKNTSWTDSKKSEFCDVKCLTEYLATLTKELIAQNVIEK